MIVEKLVSFRGKYVDCNYRCTSSYKWVAFIKCWIFTLIWAFGRKTHFRYFPGVEESNSFDSQETFWKGRVRFAAVWRPGLWA